MLHCILLFSGAVDTIPVTFCEGFFIMANKQTNNTLNFIVLYFLFFGWGFVTCLNDLLTPIFKGLFSISHFQANLVAFAFFTAYFIGSLVYVFASKFGIKFFERLGYKGLILFGLALSAAGCMIFIPAAVYKSYYIFLTGLFTIGFGFTFLQISANPLVLITGDEKTGASRLNLAGGFNSLATAIAPLIGVFVFYDLLKVKDNSENLKYPYMILAGFFILLGFMIWKFLHTKEDQERPEDHETGGKLYALNHLNLIFGMLGIFFYVGSEVTIGTNLVSFLSDPSTLSLNEASAGKLIAFYWGGAMIGRFLGSIALGKSSVSTKLLLMIAVSAALTTFLIFSAHDVEAHLEYYVVFQALAILLLLACKGSPRLNLVLFSLVNITNLIVAIMMSHTMFAAWAILSIGIFNSVMWPNIFDLGIAKLGKYNEQGASLLVMMILGGALLPVVQGYIADVSGVVTSYWIPVVGYVYILCYGLFYSQRKINWIK